MIDPTNILYGHLVSLIGGGIAAPSLLWALRKYQRIPSKPKRDENEPLHVPPWITGVFERLFFTWVVAFDVSGAAVAMIGWITLKLATNWNRSGITTDTALWSAGAFSALLAGLVSMWFAILGGLVCKGAIPW